MRAQSTAELLSAEQFLLKFHLWDIFIDCLQSCVVHQLVYESLTQLAIHPTQGLWLEIFIIKK